MSLNRTESTSSTASPLPAYNATARETTPPTYLETLSPPQKAFISTQTRLFEDIKEEIKETQPRRASEDRNDKEQDLERPAPLEEGTQQLPNEQTERPQKMSTANQWLTTLMIILLFVLPSVIVVLIAFARTFNYRSPPNDARCRKATIRSSLSYFAIALPWLLIWITIRSFRFRWHRSHTGHCHLWSLLFSMMVGLGYAIAVGCIFGRRYCR